MARKPRLNVAGNPQHVIQRGNNRQVTFFAEEDYQFYLGCLTEAAQKYANDIHAYVLMTNHVHLLVTPNQLESIARLMQSVGRRYVQYINYTYNRSGTLWEGRYKASLIQSERYLLTCMRYIELNPVRARMVKHPEEYKWSSYRANGLGATNELITQHPEYQSLGITPEQKQKAYQALFHTHLAPETLHEVRTALNSELVTGTDRFKAEIEMTLGRRVQSKPRGRPRKQSDINLLKERDNEKLSFVENFK
ncbi:MAG: transposase [Betaproteobacteria bacterium HGW-Betaproteobacteria-2]|nr:MAG: transposase [Betaproteobacteria bacterium HGW-Betaproteobacteria-2]PKP58320.1 MAG: transposase [Candidatus Atribacteria bacterium HGW-Atribacteria-1]